MKSEMEGLARSDTMDNEDMYLCTMKPYDGFHSRKNSCQLGPHYFK